MRKDAPIKSPDNGSTLCKKVYRTDSAYYEAFFLNGKRPSEFIYIDENDSDYRTVSYIEKLFIVNRSLWLDSYKIPNLDKYSEAEKQQLIKELNEKKLADRLDLFLEQGLAPVLPKSSANKQFDLLSQQLLPLKKELAEVEVKLVDAQSEKDKQRELLSSKFDYHYLLEYLKLDCATIDSSVVKYAEATINWSGVLLDKVAEYEMRQAALIGKSKKTTALLAGKYLPEPSLTEQENELLASRQQFMVQRFNLDFAEIKHSVAGLKHQGHNLKRQLATINGMPDSIGQLGELHHATRAPFDLLAENSAMQIVDKLKQMEFYEDNSVLVDTLIATERRWAEDFKALKASKTNTLVQSCNDEGIEAGDYQQWLADWYELRLQLEENLQPLLACGIENRLDQHQLPKAPVLMILEAFEDYKQAIDEFYLNDRKGVHQEVAFQANAPVQEKLAVEIALYKLSVAFQQSLQKVVFGLQDIEQRLFVFHWTEQVAGLSVGNVVDFIKNQRLDKVSQALLNDFTELKLNNYAKFIDDAQAYAHENQGAGKRL